LADKGYRSHLNIVLRVGEAGTTAAEFAAYAEPECYFNDWWGPYLAIEHPNKKKELVRVFIDLAGMVNGKVPITVGVEW
jgi:hypothetical protein